MRAVFRRVLPVLRRSAEGARSFRGMVLLCGAAAGWCLLTCWHQHAAQLGWSWQTVAGALAVLALMAERAATVRTRGSLTMCALVLAVWTVASQWAAAGMAAMAGWYPLTLLAQPLGSLLFHVPAGMMMFAVPGWCVGRLPALLRDTGVAAGELPSDADADGASFSPWGLYLAGLAFGAFTDALVAAPILGVHLSGAIGTALVACRVIVRSSGGVEKNVKASPGIESTVAPAPRVPKAAPWVLLVAIGVLIPVVGRMHDQLMAVSELVATTWWGALVGGAALGISRPRQSADPTRRRAAAGLLAACWFALVCAAFPLLVDVSLTLSAQVSTAWLLVLSRCLMTTILALPLGLAAGWALRAAAPQSAEASHASIVLPGDAFVRGGFACLVAGMLASHAGLVPHVGVRVTGIAAAFVLAAMAVAVLGRQIWPATRLARLRLATASLLIAVSPWLARSYAPEFSARLLFSTSVFTARQVSVERRFLTALDDSRLDRVVEGTRGTITLWHARGAQVQLRTNGVPSGFLSTDPIIGPQYTADVLHAALPLTLHEAPRRVLMLGTGAGAPLMTALTFPILQAECIDADPALVPLLAERAWPQDEYNPRSDDRVTFRTVEPALAVASRCGVWDVILSAPPQSALAAASAELTAGFYERCANRLAEDGIFCQRFSHIDYGPEPILVVARTMQRAFREVAAVEGAPGELLLLGTNSENGLVRPDFVKRLQARHVRHVLAQAGWDWCVPLNLAAYNHEGLAKLAGSSGVNTAANGRLASRLPWELVRWAPKWQETGERFAPDATRLLAWSTVDSGDPDLLTRLAEVTGQRKLMTTNPDQPWAYRKVLREQLAKSNRNVIVQTGGVHREMHPDDRFRRDYFEALGAAASQPDPSHDDLVRLAGFLDPYDPLLSYFAHHELAELYERKSEPDCGVELRCRLHLAWYADGRDRSIRNIVRALELLNRDDAAGVAPEMQWDQVNGLLQLLMGRWEIRGRFPPVSTQIALNDVDLSLAAAEKSLATLERIAESAGVTADECATRCTVVERSLIRPLETYRSQLLPQERREHLQNRLMMKKLEEANENGAAESP